MKALMTILCGGCLAATLTLSHAADEKKNDSNKPGTTERRERRPLTEEQKTLRKDIMAKYDTDKNGRLDKEERAKISAEDQAKLRKAGYGARERQGDGARKNSSRPGKKKEPQSK